MQTSVDVSYLADAVILLRYYESGGRIHKAISVVKKRSGPHETAIRSLEMSDGGIRVGPPLENYHGVMSGMPTYNATVGPERGL